MGWSLNSIIQREEISPNTHMMRIYTPHVARKARPGQFVIIQADVKGERIPLNIADWDEESVTCIFMEVGTSTRKFASLKAGDSVPTCAGPLGLPSHLENFGAVLLIGGCYGIGAIYPHARELKKLGNRVISIIEGRSKHMLYWAEKLKGASDHLLSVTRDGSIGEKGHVPQPLSALIKKEGINRVFVTGCTFLMKLVSDTTRSLNVKTIVCLNPIMIDGTGMCGVCRVSVGGKTKFACVDGPDFDGHEVDWELLLARRKTYTEEELCSLGSWESMRYPTE